MLDIRRLRRRDVLPVLLRHLAGQTGGSLNATDLAGRMGLDNRLVGDLVTLLESVFLVHRLGAFGRTLSARVGRTPRVHLVDTGLAAHLAGATERRLWT